MPKIKANGAEFYYELQGKGHAVVLISGYGCDHMIWLQIAKNLSQHFQVLIFDNRGVGQTKDHGEALTAELCADDVMAIVNTLNLKKPHIVGHSMGGTIAQRIASRHGSEIRKLAILNSAAKWRHAMLRSFGSILQMAKSNVEFAIIFDQLLAWSFGETFLKDEKNTSTLKKNMLANPFPQSLENQERQYQILAKFDGKSDLKHISAPTLVLAGQQDIISLPFESQFIISQIPNAKLVEFDCGHASFAEIPQELAGTLHNFLSQPVH